MVDRQRMVIGTRLTVFPERPDAAPDPDALLAAIHEVWPTAEAGAKPTLSLNLAGEALNRADSIGSRLSQAKLDAQTDRSNAEDLDMVQAISDFQNRQTGYDAALKTYSMVQRMSLFDYLK